MSRFNTASHKAKPPVALATSPIATVSKVPDTRTHEGAPGWTRDAKSELFLRTVSSLQSGSGNAYESGSQRDDRLTRLVTQITAEDPRWVLDFATWLRGSGNMRTASLMIAADFVHARPEGSDDGLSRRIINAVCARADEPGELLAYWTATYGRRLPQPVKRGLADAVRRLYSGKSLLKYDTASKSYRFGDVLNLVHAKPDPAKPWQGDLFKYALDRRHNPATAVPPASNRTLTAHRELMELPVEQRRTVVTSVSGVEALAAAGMTWETLAGWLQGPMDKAAWEAIIPSMGVMALIRNLRNFDEAGVSNEVAQQIVAKLIDPRVIASSRQFPFRFLSAHLATANSLRWAWPLEQALGHSLANVPVLRGRTLILIDMSGSMFCSKMSERSDLTCADGASLFGSALALRAENADLVAFGSTSRRVDFTKGDAVLHVMKRFRSMGGTETQAAARQHYQGHDRVVIVTDEQSHDGDPGAVIPKDVPLYTWNLQGYEAGHGPSGSHARITLGGLTDKAFTLIPLIEAGTSGVWPWQI